MATEDTRTRFKLVAQRLFAERDFDGVSVREIQAAAGQRSGGALAYYFGTKDALVRELLTDGAKAINTSRNAMLDRMEASETPSIRKIVAILVNSSISREGQPAPGYMRFIALLQLNRRQLFIDALEAKWNTGYTRCLDHLRALLDHLPSDIVNQRLIFMSFYLRAMFARRDALANRADLNVMIEELHGLLAQPMSDQTRALAS